MGSLFPFNITVTSGTLDLSEDDVDAHIFSVGGMLWNRLRESINQGLWVPFKQYDRAGNPISSVQVMFRKRGNGYVLECDQLFREHGIKVGDIIRFRCTRTQEFAFEVVKAGSQAHPDESCGSNSF